MHICNEADVHILCIKSALFGKSVDVGEHRNRPVVDDILHLPFTEVEDFF